MEFDFNPNKNVIIIPYIDLNTNDIYYYVLPNINYIDKFVKEILINDNERYNNAGTQRYNPLNYFICMDSSFKFNKNKVIICLNEFKNKPQKHYKYDFDIDININLINYNEFNENDNIKTKYIKFI